MEFPDLGRHCSQEDCYQLDFLPFKCAGCRMVFCLEHRSYKSHACPKGDWNSRKVVVCETCSSSIEITWKDDKEEDVKMVLERHDKSGDCDPWKKNKPKCPVRRCKKILTFSGSCTCKICELKVCLDHRFPTDHACKGSKLASKVSGGGSPVNKFLVALGARNAKDCGAVSSSSSADNSKSSLLPFVKAC